MCRFALLNGLLVVKILLEYGVVRGLICSLCFWKMLVFRRRDLFHHGDLVATNGPIKFIRDNKLGQSCIFNAFIRLYIQYILV